MKDVCIGITLGARAARGWAHIGVLQEIDKIGIQPDVVCGSSAGALVGGSYVAGHLEELEKWLLTLDKLDVARFLDLSLANGGLIAGKRIIGFFRDRFGDSEIDSLPKPYGAVATDLITGHEIWFRSGSLLDAVRASISIPGIFEPFHLNGNWYVDGGVLNPVPVSLCRALGADIIIAVDVNTGMLNKPPEDSVKRIPGITNDQLINDRDYDPFSSSISRNVKDRIGEVLSKVWSGNNKKKPGLFTVINNSVHFMQEHITRNRLAYDPPDILLHPQTGGIGFMDFHRAAEAIEAGKDCVRKNKTELLDSVNRFGENKGFDLRYKH